MWKNLCRVSSAQASADTTECSTSEEGLLLPCLLKCSFARALYRLYVTCPSCGWHLSELQRLAVCCLWCEMCERLLKYSLGLELLSNPLHG